MAGNFYGADVARLRTLASQAGSSAATLSGLRRRLGSEIAASAHWQGSDATLFRSDWETIHSRSMIQAVHLLEEMQRELTSDADQQETASSAVGGLAGGRPATARQATVLPPLAALGPMSPQQIHEWWTALDAEKQAEFARLHPVAAGNMDGLPIASRIEANKVAAAAQLELLDADGPSMSEEARYLRRVLSGQISLVAYDPVKGNLIELIGPYDGSTTTVLTYVPGTFAKAEDFYAGSAQKMAAYLQQSDRAGSTAAFVYKNSEFPQDSTFAQSADKDFGQQAGKKLAAFERGSKCRTRPAPGPWPCHTVGAKLL